MNSLIVVTSYNSYKNIKKFFLNYEVLDFDKGFR